MHRSVALLLTVLVALCAISSPLAAAATAQPPNDDIHIGALLPPQGAPGWAPVGEPSYYDASNLYLYIDGQAEFYIDFGFKLLVSGEYKKAGEETVIVADIYDLGDKDCALGIYTAERDESARPVKAGVEGYLSGSILNFWKGRYYVKLSAAPPSDGIGDVLTVFAQAVARRVPGDSDYPVRAQRLQQAGLVAGTIKYSPKSFLGHSFLTNTYSAEFRIGDGAPFRIFISESKSPAEAMAAYRKYRGFVGKDKQRLFEDLPGLGDKAFHYVDRFGGEFVIVVRKDYICGAAGEKVGEAERELLRKVIPH